MIAGSKLPVGVNLLAYVVPVDMAVNSGCISVTSRVGLTRC